MSRSENSERIVKISGITLLPILIGAALGAGGWLIGAHAGGGGAPALERQLQIAGEQLQMLERENESLRSLAQGGGEVAMPEEWIAKIEKDFGLEFLSSPVFHRIASEELSYRIEAALESRLGPQGMEDRQEAYRWIGWLREGDRLIDQMVAVKSVGALGWFDEVTGEAWVTDRFDLKNVPDQATMVRLLVRILLNQHFPAPSAYPGDEMARAREALHAGAASGAEARFYTASARGMGFMPMNDNAAAARLLMTLSSFIQGVTVFPVIEGKNLADTFYLKGTDALLDAMRKPPETTYAVILPNESGRGGEHNLPKTSDEIFLKESAGYLGLRLWLGLTDDVGMAEELARAWVKDAYILFADGEESTALVWDICFESQAAAERFYAVATDLAQALVEEGRFLGVRMLSDTSVRFYNTATEATALRFVN